jgi:hypothetical protein
MLGKTFKGMTDELLAWQTAALLEREERREHHVVYVRPELVVESPSTTCRRARSILAGLRCDSRASRAIVQIRPRRMPTRCRRFRRFIGR